MKRSKRIGIALVASALLFAACKDNKSEPTATPAPVVPAATSAAAAPAPSPAPPPVAPSGKMAHCPSTVTGATTAIQDAPGGVSITVTASDAASTAEIRARAAFLATSSKNDTQSIAHNGSGEGGGIFGRCPVVMRNTTVTASDVEGGTKLVVVPRDAKEQDWLRREARTRAAELGRPGSEGAGTNKMAHCPNAVKGALTSVADQKDAVMITVTAKDDASVKEIRDRAAKIAAAAKAPPSTTPRHDGTGSGGGGVGRCPSLIKDTEIAVKDAPNGAIIILKPKKGTGGDLKALDKEIRDRSAKFAAL